jgi:proteasome lid subunit RPN8/RPN11
MIHEYESLVATKLGAKALEAAKQHAIHEFPNESCGFIARGRYIACENKHVTPATHFKIDDERYDRAVANGTLKAVVHSHPNGPIFPSHADMMGQLTTDKPWVIISLNEIGIHKIVAWGGELPIAPVIARPFLHGVFDCMSLIRDVYRTGRTELLKQGVHWPFEPIPFADVAREDNWWQGEADLYTANFAKWGFKKITMSEVQAGDVFLIAVGDRRANPQQKLNHGGVLLEHDQILHHLPTRPSARTPAGVWARAADMWVRYEGLPA